MSSFVQRAGLFHDIEVLMSWEESEAEEVEVFPLIANRLL